MWSKNGMTRVNGESKLRSKGKTARSLGTKSRHTGGTNGDVWSCQCGIPGRQRRCRGGCVGRHAGGNEDDVWRLSSQHAGTAAAVWQRNSRSTRPPNLFYCKSASFTCGERLFHSIRVTSVVANALSPKMVYVHVTTHVRLPVERSRRSRASATSGSRWL